MNRHRSLFAVVMVVLVVLAVACGGGATSEPPAGPTVDPIEQSVSQTVAALAVAQTVAALTGADAGSTTVVAGVEATIAPPDVENDAPATATRAPDQAAATATPVPSEGQPVAEAPTCTTVTGVNIRSGPGTVYEPPVGTLPGGAALTPISYVARGFPQGDWLEVRVVNTGQTAWVTAGAQFVRCSVSPSSLPAPAALPPTPRPTATPTPLPVPATPTRVVAGLPPDVDNDIPGGACQQTANIKTSIQEDPNFLYRVYARDDREGQNDGDGIDFVHFSISDASREVYSRDERTAGFCIFGGGEPNCRTWPVNDQGQFTWGQGGQVIRPDTYQVFIEVVSKQADSATESNVCNWNFDMRISLP